MKISMKQEAGRKDIEVLIRYGERNDELGRLEAALKTLEKRLRCLADGKECWVNVSDIYYVESVDKKTFVYCEKEVYQTELRLYQFADSFGEDGFAQVSKACILNLHRLFGIRSLKSSRLEAELDNGERVTVTRKYVSPIRRQLSEMDGSRYRTKEEGVC